MLGGDDSALVRGASRACHRAAFAAFGLNCESGSRRRPRFRNTPAVSGGDSPRVLCGAATGPSASAFAKTGSLSDISRLGAALPVSGAARVA